MLISLNWIQKYLPTIDQVDALGVSEKLSNTLAEVESITRRGEGVDKIIVGEILQVENHPESDKLFVTQVRVGQDKTLQIIAGIDNVSKGDKVPVCLPGGSVLDPAGEFGKQKSFQIIEKELRGVKSQGMLCSPKELGLYDEHKGIMILSPDEIIGNELTSYLKDTILEIENKSLTHRPDCFSHLGIAREIAAIYNLDLKGKESDFPFTKTEDLPLKIDFQVDEKVCQRFTAMTLKDISIKTSPFWLQASLANVGQKPVNNIVDMSNYVMFDKGQPNHIFDYDKLEGNKIEIRVSKGNEKIETIDGDTHTIARGSVVLSDSKKLIGIPGIMGGKETEISEGTQNIAIIVEHWDMYTIRRESRDLGIRTDASTRFEKGLDPTRLVQILKLVTNNIVDTAGGEISSEIIDIYPNPEEPHEITFDLNSVQKFIGVELTKEEIVTILESLGIKVIGDEKIEENKLNLVDESNKIRLDIPHYRRDLKIKEDILEEIARMYGYHKLSTTLPTRDLTPPKENHTRRSLRNLKNFLSGLGATEIYSYSMIGQELAENSKLDIDTCLKIRNPLSPELSHMRNSLTPSMLEKLKLNLKNKFDNFALFEISRIIQKDNKNEDGLPNQPMHLVVGYTNTQEQTYRHIKGFLDSLNNNYGLDLKIENLNGKGLNGYPEAYHPVQTARILLDSDTIGVIGNIHPVVKNNFNIKSNVSLLELDLTKLLDKFSKDDIRYQAISEFPAVYRDLSFWVPESQEVGPIIDAIKQDDNNHVEDVKLDDIFSKGKETEEGRKSITLSIVLRSNNKTLESNDIDSAMSTTMSTLQKQFKAEIRK